MYKIGANKTKIPKSPSKLEVWALHRRVCMVAALMNRHVAVALVINLMACPAGSIKGRMHVGDTWSVMYYVR